MRRGTSDESKLHVQYRIGGEELDGDKSIEDWRAEV